MRYLSRCNGWVVAALVVASAAAAPHLDGQPVGSAFTYQGRLDDGGAPATGVFDLRFELYDAEGGGAAVAPTVYVDDLAVSGGLITQSLDFGHSAFDGNPRWLEVAVRAAGSSDPYVTLAPRHELTPAPYARFAVTAASAAQVNWSDVTAKPVGFADDLDDDLLSALPCAAGQVPQHTGFGWSCGSAGSGTVTSVLAGSGLQATPSNPITGSGEISIDSTVVPLAAASNTFTGTQTMQPATAAGRALVVRGAAAQTAALQEWQDGSGVTVASVNAAGVFTGDGSGLANLPAGGSMMTARVNSVYGTSTLHGSVTGLTAATATETDVTTLSMNRACTAGDLAVRLTAAPGTGSSVTVELSVNFASTLLSCTVADAQTTCGSGSLESPVPAGSELMFRFYLSGTPSASDALVGWSCRW